MTWQMKLRATCINSITPDDMKDIVGTQVAKAKKGDPEALKFVMALLNVNDVRVTNNIITDPETAAKIAKGDKRRNGE